MVTREELIVALKDYQSNFAAERKFIKMFLKLLEHPRAFYRDHLPGHITGSAFIIDIEARSTLLTHHAKLNRWLQPGGHADGEENIGNVALREAQEETGLKTLTIARQGIFDIDVHTIPARPDFPEHDHYDVRFLFHAAADEQLQVTEESHDLAWKPLHQLASITGNNISMLRMAAKVESLTLK
jgi:8-oxo-dGTP pyrophosphatase MutT (NUDIX family)